MLDLKVMAESEKVFVLYILPASETEFRYVVRVAKNRPGNSSEHRFTAMGDALQYVSDHR